MQCDPLENKDYSELADIVEAAFDDDLSSLDQSVRSKLCVTLENTLDLLDKGKIRVANKSEEGSWSIQHWIRKAILLFLKLKEPELIEGGPDSGNWWDKVPSKFKNWTNDDFKKGGFRVVPNCVVRHSAYIAPGVVLMPSFVNMGAYVDSGTMIDSWATVGSCAQIGKNVHISAGVTIGGVLEPVYAMPTIVEDDCFVGANVVIAEGLVIGTGSVISTGVCITGSTKIVNRDTGEIFTGFVPPHSVVVPGTLPVTGLNTGLVPSIACAVIVKRPDEETRMSTSINELLR